jgi:heterodisulfide reductase subunit A-like polyferredoxin
MAAALSMAGQGYHTYLIEKTDALGGQARNLYQTWRGEDVQQHLNQLIQDRVIELLPPAVLARSFASLSSKRKL